jgi:hypothetical protein
MSLILELESVYLTYLPRFIGMELAPYPVLR